eukprot:4398289-Alexandrium_andersonii.AAC.1
MDGSSRPWMNRIGPHRSPKQFQLVVTTAAPLLDPFRSGSRMRRKQRMDGMALRDPPGTYNKSASRACGRHFWG